MSLQRKLGLTAVLAVVVGDMIGSGIFFTPGELAAVATSEWQVYFFWALCGFITLCGALTLAELSALIPKAGVSYHALTEAYGPFAGFMQAWMMVLVSGPGAIAGVAILFGELANQVFGSGTNGMQLAWAVAAILFFAVINLRGAEWGGRTQIVLTSIKIAGLAALIIGGIFIATPAAAPPIAADTAGGDQGLIGFLRFVGLGVAIVLFTYDGWIDASNVAGEVKNPNRNFPLAMGAGVILIVFIYLLVNYAFLRVVPLEEMRANPTLVAPMVAEAAFGEVGGTTLSILMWISIFGALGGLIMTLPRLFYAAASEYVGRAQATRMRPLFRAMAYLSPKHAVPSGAILFGEMRANPTLVAPMVAEAAFGEVGGTTLSILMWISIFGALGGLIMTLPRLFYAAASEYVGRAQATRMRPLFRAMAYLSPKHAVPSGAILFAAVISIAALFFFRSFSRIITFFVVPFQFMNILMVSSIFILRPRLSRPGSFRLPAYPLVPAIFIVVMFLFMVAALIYNPLDSLIGIALTLAGAPVYAMLARQSAAESDE